MARARRQRNARVVIDRAISGPTGPAPGPGHNGPPPVMSAPGMWAQTWPMLQYNPSHLLGKQGIDLFDRMMLDDQVKAAVAFKTESVLATGWQVISPEDQPPDWEVTAFVRRRLEAIHSSFERSLRNMLSATSYGYSITEVIYEQVSSGEDANMIGIHALKTKAPHKLRFKLDDYGNIEGIINDQDGKTYPAGWKFIIWSHGDRFGNPYGISDLEACYRPYVLALNSYRWLGQYLERLGIPPWFALYNPAAFEDEQQLRDLKTIMTNLQNATSAAVPRPSKDDFEIWSPTASGNVATVFVPALELFKHDIARALLMPGQLGISPDATQGSLAKARVALDMFLLSLNTIQGDLAEIIQHQLVNPLVDLNFNTNGVYPVFKFLPLTEDDVAAISAAWGELVDRDIVNSDADDEQHLRGMLKFPRSDPEDTQDQADENKRPRIPLRYLEKLTGALKRDEVRASLGLEPLGGEDGEGLMTDPTAAAAEQAKAAAEALAKSRNPDGTANDNQPGAGGNQDGPDDNGNPPDGNRGGQNGNRPPGNRQPPRAANNAAMFADETVVAVDDQAEEPEPPAPDSPGLTQAERRCDFVAMAQQLDEAEFAVVAKIAGLLRGALRSQLDGWLKRPPTLTRAAKVQASIPLQIRAAIVKTLKGLLAAGRKDAAAEIAKGGAKLDAAGLPTYNPEAAIAFLEGKADFFVTGLSSRLTEIVRAELLFGLRNGLPFTEVRNRILAAAIPWIGPADADPAALRPDRLLTAVRTAATDAYNQGRVIDARRLSGSGLVTGMQHSSILDNRTTPICRGLQGKCYRIDDPQLDRFTPPLHFRCLAAGVLVGTEGPVLSKSAREYRGEIISIRTRSGKQLTGTPNHPVLTDRGWVALGLLHEGDRVIRRSLSKGVSGIEVDDQHMPTLIEDVAVTPLSPAGVLSVVVPTAAEDFHGDGVGGKVCVVSADSLLWRRLHAARAKHLLELLLLGATQMRPGVALASQGDLDPVLVSLTGWAVAHGLVGSPHKLFTAFLAELRHALQHGLTAPASIYAGLVEASQNGGDGNAHAGSDIFRGLSALIALHNLLDREIELTLQRLPGFSEPAEKRRVTDGELANKISSGSTGPIETDDIVSVERKSGYHGIVYNIETTGGYYTADSIIVHNCRSVLIPIMFTDDISSDPSAEEHWITPEEVAEAQRLVPGEFGGAYTATQKNRPKS